MNQTTTQDIAAHKQSGSWRKLEQLALLHVADAQRHAASAFEPKLGGGTRLMLALNHRISHDIDLFIRDPQWIGYLTPRLNDQLEIGLKTYSETAVSLKLEYAIGEIDFIVGMSLLGLPDEKSDETSFILEPVAEVLAKKLFYRGWALTPRDLFDWWAIETQLPETVPVGKMAQLLRTKFPEIYRSLDSMLQSHSAKSTWDAIQAPNKPDMQLIALWGKGALDRYVATDQELVRRVDSLKNLVNSSGASHTFWRVATEAISACGGNVQVVDWQAVEQATIRQSISKNGQSPASVYAALCNHSPGAVTQSKKEAIQAEIERLAPQLQSQFALERAVDHDLSQGNREARN